MSFENRIIKEKNQFYLVGKKPPTVTTTDLGNRPDAN